MPLGLARRHPDELGGRLGLIWALWDAWLVICHAASLVSCSGWGAAGESCVRFWVTLKTCESASWGFDIGPAI